jgi:hypothetical protein
MNIEEYIKSLLSEQDDDNNVQQQEPERLGDIVIPEEFKKVKLDENDVNLQYCIKKWKAQKSNLTDKQAYYLYKAWLVYVKPRLNNMTNQPEFLTFFIRYVKQNNNGLFPSLPGNEYEKRTILKELFNVKYTKAELALKQPGATEALKKAIKNDLAEYEFGSIEERDENGKVIMIQKKDAAGNPLFLGNGKPQMIAKRKPFIWITSKMRIALENAVNKDRAIGPYFDKMKDPKNYSLDQINFLVAEFWVELIRTAEGQTQQRTRDKSTLVKSDANVEMSRNLQSNLDSNDLVWKSGDGKIRIYDIKDQWSSIEYGFYFEKAGLEMVRLERNGIIVNKPANDDRLMEWCVTKLPPSGYYSSYRTGEKAYKFYLLVNDNYNFMSMSPEELKNLPIDSPLRQWNNAINYGNMICLQKDTEAGKSSSMIVCDLRDREINRDWSWIESNFPGLTKEIAGQSLFYKPFSKAELVDPDDKKSSYVNDIDGENFFGAASQRDKSIFIRGTHDEYRGRWSRGTITSVDTWRTLSDDNKKAYITQTDNRSQALDKFKNLLIFEEIRYDSDIYGQFVNTFNQLDSREPGTLDAVKNQMLSDTYITDEVWRYSIKNKNIKLLQQKNNRDFYNLINVDTCSKLVTPTQEYISDYTFTHTFIFLNGDDDNQYIAEKYDSSLGSDAPDTLWAIYDSGSDHCYFLNKKSFEKCIDEGIIEIPDLDDAAEGVPGSIKLGSFKNREEVFENKKLNKKGTK